MPTGKKSAKSSKKSAKKSAKKGGQPASGKNVFPPPDNPLLRHLGSTIDRRVVTGDEQVDAANLTFAAALSAATERAAAGGGRSRKAARKAPLRAPGAAAAAGGEGVGQLAKRRLAALESSRGMPHVEDGAPMLMTAAAAAGPQGVAPVSGVSNWVQLGPTAIPKGQTYGGGRVLVTGRVTSIVIDPTNTNIIYCGTAQGGVWKTTDGGANWVAKSDNEVSLSIGALAMDPADHLTLYAGTGEGNFSLDSYYGSGVLKTTNGGDTWTAQGTSTFVGGRFSRIAVTPGTPARVFAATGFGVYRSTNGGTSWSLMSSGLPAISDLVAGATDVVIDPTTPMTVYAAFWGGGVYKTTNAGAATPNWTKLAGGLPTATSPVPNGFTRVALGLSPSSPQTIYALFANNDTDPLSPTAYDINKFYVSTNGGTNWSQIALPGGSLGVQGFYNLNVALDPTTPDIVYLSAISLWKATRNAATGVWTFTDVGGGIHPDNHALAFHPTNHLNIYAGSDGGIYKSTDAGSSWNDTINEGLCIAQFEFIDHHPTSDAVVFGGTQDNGTEQFRNSPVFYHAADGDGGYALIDQSQPRNVLHTYYGNSPERSTLGGKWGDYPTSGGHLNWTDVSPGIDGSGLFYPPMALDQTNQNNIAFGTDRINLDAAQGTGGWPTKVTLPGIADGESVSAIYYATSTLLYAGTDGGKVYRLTKSGTTWSAAAIHAAPLPSQTVTDLVTVPGTPNTIIVVMAGFGTGHVWRGVFSGSGAAAWTDISGSGATAVPDIPTNAVVIDPAAANTFYVATDVAVYRTTNGGTSWTQFSQGLPNCAVFDLKLHNPTRLLRAGTHGRGLWERKLDVPSVPDVDIYFRDHLMSTGRIVPTPDFVPAAFEDPLQYVSLGDSLSHWMCADIKVDALEGTPPSFQMPVSAVDYVAYESVLQHRNAQRGNVNRVYVKVNNRGFAPAANVTVKLLFADASAGLPPLPPDFWTAFPNNSANTTQWKPVGNAKVIALLSPTEPTILEWDLALPTSAANHSCLLVVMDCPADPIPAANKTFAVDPLVRNEKRVGLKNLQIVNIPPSASIWTPLNFYSVVAGASGAIRLVGADMGGSSLALLLPRSVQPTGAAPSKGSKGAKTAASAATLKLDGFVAKKTPLQMEKSLKEHLPNEVTNLDLSRLYTLDQAAKGGGRISGLKIPKAGLRAAVLLTAPAQSGKFVNYTVVQEENGEVIGGNTYIVVAKKG